MSCVIGCFECFVLRGVLVREIINFSSFWRSSIFSAIVEPIVYLFVFGFGFGLFVSMVGGYDYVDYVGTGMVVIVVLFFSAFLGMFGMFVKYKFQRIYDVILVVLVDIEEFVTVEVLWIVARVGTYGCALMLVVMLFGLDPSWGMLLVLFIGFIVGFGWVGFGIFVAVRMNLIDNFSYVISVVLMLLFFVVGTFFLIDGLLEWVQVIV